MLKIEGMSFEKFLSESQIQARVTELGQEINSDYSGESEPLVILGVLNGSFRFLADLIRELSMPTIVDFVKLKSYKGISQAEGKELLGLSQDLKGKKVLIVEDIIDTGRTYDHLLEVLKSHELAEVKLATLLYKPGKYEYKHPLDYIAFEIGDEFVLGYGLDYKEEYRELNDIYKRVI